MIDLTNNERQKDYYITKVELADDYKKYTVHYASGRKVVYPFSVHNYNVDINHMVRQYYEYKDSYIKRIANLNRELLSEKVRKTALTILLGTMMYDMIEKPTLKLLSVLITLLIYTKNNIDYNEKKMEYIFSFMQIDQMKNYIENKEKLKVTVIDPVFKEEYDWYLYNLSDTENTITEPNLYERKATSLTPEMKKRLGEKITKDFNGEITEEKIYTI